MASSKLVIFFCMALLATAATARGIKKPKSICDSVDTTERALCKKLAGKAHTWPEAMTTMLASVRGKVLAGKHIAYGVADKLPASVKPEMRADVGSVCQEVYDMTLESIDNSIESVHSPAELSNHLSYMSTFSDCTDALQGLNVKLPKVEKFQREVQKLSSLLLAVAELKH